MKHLISLVLVAAFVSLVSDSCGNVVVPRKRPDVSPPPFTNSIGMKFVWIPPGTFMMGSPKEEKGRRDNETQHKVTLTKGFYMGIHLVTQEHWMEFMGHNPSNFKGETNLLVEQISWYACQEFIKKLRATDKKAYRLPTEAEWEYACRSGTTTPFSFGETISIDQANFDGTFPYGNSKKGIGRDKTTPVGSFKANAFGLHDMHGNVSQSCQDWYGEHSTEDAVDPKGPEKGEMRLLRGGSWVNYSQYLRSACRMGNRPGALAADYGIRLCFSVE